MKSRELWFVEGRLRVKAKGFWYTSGGDKGVFGYYPHLKVFRDSKWIPVYPDTQIHGDLRTSAKWLDNLEGNKRKALINMVFGKSASPHAAHIQLTDLEPEHADIDFLVKPKIEIDDATGCVKKSMLVYREYAYLQDIILTSRIYLSYFPDKEKLSEAKKLVQDSVQFLGCVGAFRSRGKGRGEFSISWEDDHVLTYSEPAEIPPFNEYYLTSLVHFRNRPPSLGRGQLIKSVLHITPNQLKGWFSRAYYSLFGEWPTLNQMKEIHLTPAYPAAKNKTDDFILLYPAPMSTLQREDGSIRDFYDSVVNEEQKLSTPGRNRFISNEDQPRCCEISTHSRTRNVIEENFTTRKEAGLFSQEFIPRETTFGCSIRIDNLATEFGRKAYFIFRHLQPIINGCLFSPSLTYRSRNTSSEAKKDSPFLLIAPMNFDRYTIQEEKSQILLTTTSSYNTTLGRQRRKRPVFAPGSILSNYVEDVSIRWKGFGKEIKRAKEQILTGKEQRQANFPEEIPGKSIIVSNAQIGILRNLIQMSDNHLRTRIRELAEKYDRWKGSVAEQLIPKEIVQQLNIYLQENEIETMRDYILNLIDNLYVTVWNSTIRSKTIEEFESARRGIAE